MNWLYFILGFFAFPTAIVLFVFFHKARNTTIPIRINKTADLQAMLRKFMTESNNNDLLYVVCSEEKLLIRIKKSTRKLKSDTLAVELRNNSTNQTFYPLVRERLCDSGIEFEENFTPNTQKPKCIRITYPEGGVIVITAVCTALTTMLDLKDTSFEPGILLSDRDPFSWAGNPLQN